MTRSSRILVLAAAAFVPTLIPTMAFAHPGHAEHAGFAAGLGHPFNGTDHLLALAAVGLLAGRLGGRAMYLLLGAWMSLLVVGGLAGVAGVELPGVRPLLIVSIGVCAALAILVPRTPTPGLAGGIVALASFFAFFHGFAHGARALDESAGLAFVAGVAAASAFVLALTAAVTKNFWPAATATARR